MTIKPFLMGVVALLLASGCTSFSGISTDGQRAAFKSAEKIFIKHRDQLRSAADGAGARGVLVFANEDSGTLGDVLPGDTPRDAWLQYVARTSDGKRIEDLPLPSNRSRFAAFIYKASQYAPNRIIYSAELDEEVAHHYDLSSAMSRLGSDLQDLRDITILLSRSDHAQNESVARLKSSFDTLAGRVGSLKSQLEKVRNDSSASNAELDRRMDEIVDNLQSIQRKLNEIR